MMKNIKACCVFVVDGWRILPRHLLCIWTGDVYSLLFRAMAHYGECYKLLRKFWSFPHRFPWCSRRKQVIRIVPGLLSPLCWNSAWPCFGSRHFWSEHTCLICQPIYIKMFFMKINRSEKDLIRKKNEVQHFLLRSEQKKMYATVFLHFSK
jgi:hypothetical protein